MDGDIESNPGPKTKTTKENFFHVVIAMSIAHNRLSMLEAYSVTHKYDVICISESYLDSTVLCLYVLQGKLIP